MRGGREAGNIFLSAPVMTLLQYLCDKKSDYLSQLRALAAQRKSLITAEAFLMEADKKGTGFVLHLRSNGCC